MSALFHRLFPKMFASGAVPNRPLGELLVSGLVQLFGGGQGLQKHAKM